MFCDHTSPPLETFLLLFGCKDLKSLPLWREEAKNHGDGGVECKFCDASMTPLESHSKITYILEPVEYCKFDSLKYSMCFSLSFSAYNSKTDLCQTHLHNPISTLYQNNPFYLSPLPPTSGYCRHQLLLSLIAYHLNQTTGTCLAKTHEGENVR